MADRNEAGEAILDGITNILQGQQGSVSTSAAQVVRDLAEAYAWLAQPDQPHGR